MKNVNVSKRRKNQKGFTLVELAVVMIIVGLLIGGILKGQELIANAQVASLVTQAKGIDAGISTFRDSYRAFPGDMNTAQARLPNCVAGNNCFNGGGTGIIDNPVTGVGTAAAAGNGTQESGNFFTQMALAGNIGGVDPTGGAAYGGQFPDTPVGGGFSIGHTNAGAISAQIQGGATVLGGHYLIMNSALGALAASTGPINASQAARIDRKMDDGNADSGSVRSNGGTCLDAAGDYDEENAGAGCALVFRVQS